VILLVRWYHWGVIIPVFRTHCHRPNNEPRTVGGDIYPHLRAQIFLRERLRPYAMEQMRLASAKGLPPMRPLFFDFPDDPQTAEVEDAYLFGPDLLIAPITRFGVRSREVNLPAGTDWMNVWTGEKFTGGPQVVVDAPIEHIPDFARSGKEALLQEVFIA
jgi:alpha-D-xyloside xylohydrolase